MPGSLVVIDTSTILNGKLEEVQSAVHHLVAFVEANEPRPIAYGVHLSPNGTEMVVVQVHPDSASMEFHMKVAGPAFSKFAGLLQMTSLHVYGTPSEPLLDQLQRKAKMLGGPAVVVHPLHAGFARIASR